ncbi:MAG: PilZ domain-containing protein [Desulfobulbaceae bacterium]|nr:PilZ domain-containing protein [Desulfobulbaceae bacterium]HIJ78679.1 PilZ domain-containing protein [Deltaproteobacteria bacterium]
MVEQSKAESMEDRRQHERCPKNLAIRYVPLEDLMRKASRRKDGELLDIAAGGLCFLTDETLALGSQLVVVLEFPGWLAQDGQWIATKQEEDKGVLQVVGMVVWVAVSQTYPDKYEIGLQFSGIITT